MKMKKTETSEITNELFNIIKQIPRLAPNWTSMEGLTRSEYELLLFININNEDGARPFSMTELSRELNITPAAITHLANPLEKAGLIKRNSSNEDRRIVLISLTTKGNEKARQLMKIFRHQLAGLIEHLGMSDSQTFIRLMKSVLVYLDEQRKI